MNRRGKISAVLFFFAVCGSSALVTNHWLTRAARVRPSELYAVVHSQLTAMRAANFPQAYREASSGLQQKFDIRQFSEMIRTDYAGIVNAERVEFGFAEMEGRRAIIQVFFFDKDGQVTPCIYTLVNEGETWKIDSARLLRRWPAGARLGGMRS